MKIIWKSIILWNNQNNLWKVNTKNFFPIPNTPEITTCLRRNYRQTLTRIYNPNKRAFRIKTWKGHTLGTRQYFHNLCRGSIFAYSRSIWGKSEVFLPPQSLWAMAGNVAKSVSLVFALCRFLFCLLLKMCIKCVLDLEFWYGEKCRDCACFGYVDVFCHVMFSPRAMFMRIIFGKCLKI